MSKVDIQIEFDRSDRDYRAGETVSGAVTILANQDVDCNGLVLEHFWQTHGKGNRDEGANHRYTLYTGPWRAGETARYPFEFKAPNGPPTYRGNYLNIDHYVRVRADLPWAFDPKVQEEFLLAPSRRIDYEGVPESEQQQNAPRYFTKHFVIGGVVFLLLGVMCMFPFGIILIPLAMFCFWMALRNSMLEKRLGDVQLQCGATHVTPGTTLPVRIQFTPRKAFRINGITASLTGHERCVSGSGTNTTTYTHKLHDETFQIAAAHELVPNARADFAFEVPIPETDAYSFKSSDNQIAWELNARIDIPKFPDWKRKEVLLVLPVAESSAAAESEVQTGISPPARTPVDASTFEASPLEISTADANFAKPVPPAAAKSAGPSLDEVCERIVQTSRYGDDRRRIIHELRDVVFDCEMDFDRIERTVISDDVRFRDGRTITGRLAKSGLPVSVLVSDAKNEEVDRLMPGSRGRLRCKLAEWDTLFDRAKLHYV